MEGGPVNECLAYFRQAIESPGSIPVWAAWWAEHETQVRQCFPRMDYIRLKHRKLDGAAVLLERTDWEPPPERARDPMFTGFCSRCGERVVWRGSVLRCPNGCYWAHAFFRPPD